MRNFRFLLSLLFFSLFVQSFCLDFTDLYSGLSDAFVNFLDENEGTTSFRSLYIPSGGRSEGMGTTFTALADDIGFLEYNPAASSILEKTEIALFHNSWIADSSVETAAYTMRKTNFGWGASVKCFHVPFTEYNSFGERRSSGYYSETTATLNASYNFLAGYNFKGLAAGINFKAAYRSIPDYTDDSTGSVISGSGLSQSAVAFMSDLGLLMRFNLFKYYASRDPNFNFALVVSNLGAGFTSLGKKPQFDNPLPTRISCGISYRFIRPVILALEYRQPLNLFNIRNSEKFSASFGTSIQCTNFLSVQAGFLLSGANPRISAGTEFLVHDFLISANYTFDMTSSVSPVNRISICAKLALGDGGRGSLQKEIDSFYLEGLKLYSEGRLDDAIEMWNACLELDPGFDPAISARKAANRAKEQQETLKRIQSLNNN